MARLRTKRQERGIYARYQNGGGFTGSVYKGKIYRHRGGNAFSSIAKLVKPLVQNVVKKVGQSLGKKMVRKVRRKVTKQALKSGIKFGIDVASGKNVKQAAKKRGQQFARISLKQTEKNIVPKKRKISHHNHHHITDQKGGRLGKFPRKTYTTFNKNKRNTKNVFGE